MRNKLNVFFLGSSFVGTERERKYNQTKKKAERKTFESNVKVTNCSTFIYMISENNHSTLRIRKCGN